jgi:cytosine/adenosine deaminase-related metal-dependent hydrolase
MSSLSMASAQSTRTGSYIEGERIAAVGPMSELGGTAVETIDVRGMLVMPGLVNLHNHHWASCSRTVKAPPRAVLDRTIPPCCS